MRRTGHSRLPRPCPSVRLQRVSQLLSLMSVTDERRIGYCGGNQCSGPGGLPLSLSCWGLVARIGDLAARGGGYRRVGPFLTPDRHRAIQNEPRSPPSHPEAAAQGDELGRL